MSITTDRSKSSPTADSQTLATRERPTLELSVPQVVGGALAAATSALAASFLGVAGTLAGAVVGSVVATIGAAVYSHSLGHAAVRLRVVRPDGSLDPGTVVAADTSALAASGSDNAARHGPRPLAAGRRWLRLSAGVALGVVLALAGITVVEMVIGHPVSGSTNSGTSIGQAVGVTARAGTAGTSTSTAPTSTTTSATATPSDSASVTAPSASGTGGATTGPTAGAVGPTAGTATTAPGAGSTGR